MVRSLYHKWAAAQKEENMSLLTAAMILAAHLTKGMPMIDPGAMLKSPVFGGFGGKGTKANQRRNRKASARRAARRKGR